MELVNHTHYPAGIARMVIGQDDRLAASVLLRITYDIGESAPAKPGEGFLLASSTSRVEPASLTPSEEQPWIVSRVPWEGPKGTMDGDLVFYKDGVDVFLFGHAVPPAGESPTEMDVEVRVGEGFRRRVRVFGPRVWYRRATGLVPTAPLPIKAVPLTLKHAFGGTDVWDELPVPWPENPEGTGFYVTEENAIDRPLPSIEEPDHLVSKWEDRPPVAGLGPLPVGSALRSKQGLSVGQAGPPKITPRLFNAAFAPMIAPAARPGDVVTVTGVSESGPLALALPAAPFFVRLRFGEEEHELPLAIDQIGILADERRAFVAYRCPFRYIVVPLQKRTCELFERP